jgi:hypothetical protein
MRIVGAKDLASFSISDAGADYAANDLLTIAGGTATVAAKVKVLTVDSSGAILTAEINVTGNYTVNPTLTNNVPTGGAGTGAKLNLVMGEVYYDVAPEVTYSGVTTNNDPEATYQDAGCTVKEWGES